MSSAETNQPDTLGDFLRLTGFTPFRIVETPDYAEIHAANGDGQTAFALTMSPSFFEELNRLAALASADGPTASPTEGDRT